MSNQITLTHRGTYKDGGSEGYVDSKGNKYWINYKFGEKGTDSYGKLFEGDINNKERKLAKGRFRLLSITYKTQKKVITEINQ